MDLGRLEQFKDLRKVWPDEARNFTPWLASDENITLLSEALGIDIEVVEIESSVGSFNVDIYAKDSDTGQKIIIENQLEDTNHDHLGKLITYASGKDASVLVWIVRHAREEHKSAVEWLNSHFDENIAVFLCEIKLYRIGNSPIAPTFEIVEQPNEWAKASRRAENISDFKQLRLEYWSAFNEYIQSREEYSNSLKCRRPTVKSQHWFKAETNLCHYEVALCKGKSINDASLSVAFAIDKDKQFFWYLHERREEIEKSSNLQFEWCESSNKKKTQIKVGGPEINLSRDLWEEQFEWMAETLLKFQNAFGRYIKEYKNL